MRRNVRARKACSARSMRAAFVAEAALDGERLTVEKWEQPWVSGMC
jgi:hypothetical protein